MEPKSLNPTPIQDQLGWVPLKSTPFWDDLGCPGRGGGGSGDPVIGTSGDRKSGGQPERYVTHRGGRSSLGEVSTSGDFQFFLHHLGNKFVEGGARGPAEFFFCLGGVAQKIVDFGGA